jgi:hypothetical protein
LERIERLYGETLHDVAVRIERAWLTLMNQRGTGGYDKYQAYKEGGRDAIIEVHRAFVSALARGPPDTQPLLLKEYTDAQLKSRRDRVSDALDAPSFYDKVSIVPYAAEFDPSEGHMRTLWAAASAANPSRESGRDTSAASAAGRTELEIRNPHTDELRRQMEQKDQKIKQQREELKTLQGKNQTQTRRTHEPVGALVDGVDSCVDYSKMIDVVSRDEAALAELRQIADCPPGPPSTWRVPEPTITVPDKPGKRLYTMNDCWACRGKDGYKAHRKPEWAQLGAGHDLVFCHNMLTPLSRSRTLKSCIIPTPAHLQRPQVGGSGGGGNGFAKKPFHKR